MTSIMWYLYEFARKAWVEGFADSKSKHDIVEKPDRFRDFPKVIKEYCIGCGSCTTSCPSPNAIKLVRDKDTEDVSGLTYPIINKSACIRCGFCAEVCPSEPKSLECGENHFIDSSFNIIPSKRQYVIDNYLCIKCKKCMKTCKVGAISLKDDKMFVDQLKCIGCGDCLEVCPVKGAMKGIFSDNLEDQKALIKLVVDTLEEFIESKQSELEKISQEELLKLELPLNTIWDKAIEIIPDNEIAYEIIENTVNRLKIRIVTWNQDKCEKCQLCVDECPIGAIEFSETENKIIRDKDKCCRCSICYQTCPFKAINYFISKFILDVDEDGEDVIFITVKTSQLDQNFVRGQ